MSALYKRSDMSRAITIFCIGSLLLAALYILQQSVQNYQDGGDLWKQGDWLINSELGPVRRAFLGNIILRISDISNTSPLLITWLIQVILLTALITLLLLAIKSSQATPIIWTIILSPAFFLFFWAAEPRASIRKELIIYVAFLCLLTAYNSLQWTRLLIVLSTFLFVVGIIGHEAMALFFPAYVICLMILVKKNNLSSTFIYIPIGIALSASVGSILYALAHPSVEDFQQVCQPLLKRGLNSSICDGAIKWLEYDTKTNSDLVRNYATASKFSKLALGYALSSIGFIFFAYHTNAYSKVMALYATSAIPFIPLFALGIDWGRWLNFHFSSAVFISIALLISGSLKIEKNHSNIYLITFLLSNFIWSIGRVAPLTPFGVLGQAYRTLF